MRHLATSMRRTSLGIGLGCGILAGAIGLAQWMLTARDTSARVADFQTFVQRNNPEFVDWTGVSGGSQEYWFITAVMASILLLAVYRFAGAAAARSTRSRRGGMVGAATAIAIGSVAYVAAGLVAYVLSSTSSVTGSIIAGMLIWEPLLGLAFISAALHVAWTAAGKVEHAGIRAAPGRQTL